MRRPLTFLALSVSLLLLGTERSASTPRPLWSRVAPDPSGVPGVLPGLRTPFRVELGELTAQLLRAPREGAGESGGVELSLPFPDGRLERFLVVESPILAPSLARALPDAHTYFADGIDSPRNTARIDLTSLGVRAMITTPEGTVFVDPAVRGRTDLIVSYWARDDIESRLFDCQMIERGSRPRRSGAGPTSLGGELHTYRLILTGTGEYTQFLGGLSPAIAEMVTSVNRVNAIYERDLGIRLEAVALLPFDDPQTDPYTAGFFDLDRNQVVVDSIFGSQSYDLAQVEVQQGSPGALAGVSYTPAVCSEVKAGSVVSAGDVSANDIMIKVMAHELGHVLGALHAGGCGLLLASSWEPGSGTTIMGRAGKCGVNDVVPAPGDLYFNSQNIEEIFAATAGVPDCGTEISTGNTPPTANAGPDYTIPRATPFVLVGGGFDSDVSDSLTFCWEQHDMAASLNDTTTGPLVRSRLGTASRARPIPAITTVLADTVDRWERLAREDRQMQFRLTVRDQHPGGGAVAWDEKTITVSGEPFAISYPDGGESIASGPFTVTWAVGGGAIAPTVDILLSTDGGANWQPVATNTANDGSEAVTYFTSLTLPACRIKVEAVGNVFYDVSHANFTIIGGATSADGFLPAGFGLGITGPNPTRGVVTFDVALPRSAEILLRVYSISGRLVRSLASGSWPAGKHRVPWAGETNSGRRAGPGAYVARLEADGHVLAARTVVLR